VHWSLVSGLCVDGAARNCVCKAAPGARACGVLEVFTNFLTTHDAASANTLAGE
jgi:hypothetical protein